MKEHLYGKRRQTTVPTRFGLKTLTKREGARALPAAVLSPALSFAPSVSWLSFPLLRCPAPNFTPFAISPAASSSPCRSTAARCPRPGPGLLWADRQRSVTEQEASRKMRLRTRCRGPGRWEMRVEEANMAETHWHTHTATGVYMSGTLLSSGHHNAAVQTCYIPVSLLYSHCTCVALLCTP